MRSLLTILSLIVVTSAASRAEFRHPEDTQPCPEIVTDLVPGLNARVARKGLPHVEIRRCDSIGGAMQVVAWAKDAELPSLVLLITRFSVGPILMAGNVFAMVFPGPYDSIVVVQYNRGAPKVVFTDSTHAEIQITETFRKVQVKLDFGGGKATTKSFTVDESQLEAPR
jgi:hypothetical protein